MGSEIRDGEWFEVASESEHAMLLEYGRLTPTTGLSARIHHGEYVGPGRYMVLRYWQRCPRNCCDDDVIRVLSATDVMSRVRNEMRELADILKAAKGCVS